jgi:predicted MFS family arabinose efflux permease
MAPSPRRSGPRCTSPHPLARLWPLFGAYLVSQAGSWVFRAAALYAVYDARNGSVVALAAGVVLAYLPILVGARCLAPLADRVPARRLLVGVDVLRAVALLPLLVVDADSPAAVPLNLAVIAALSLTSPLFTAGQSAHIRRTVDTNELTAALGLLATIEWLTFTLGASVGALLLLTTGMHAVVAVDIASFVGSAAVLARWLPGAHTLPGPRPAKGRVALPAGVPVVLLAVFLLNLGAGLINLYPNVLAREVAGPGHPGLSAFYLTNGVGGLIGATLATWLASRMGPAHMVRLAGLLVTIALLAMSRISTAMLPLLASSAMLLFGQVFAVGAQSWLLRLHPPALAGRASGHFTGATFSGVAANAALAALLIPPAHVTTTFVAFVLGCAAVSGLAVIVTCAPTRARRALPVGTWGSGLEDA